MFTDKNGMGLMEQISMLENVKEELAQLQARVDYIAPRAEAYGVVCQILSFTNGGRIMGGAERSSDRVTRAIDQRLSELKGQREMNKELAQKAAQTGRELGGLEKADRGLVSSHEKAVLMILDDMKLPHRSQMEFIALLRAAKKRMPDEVESVKDSPEADRAT